MPPATTATNIHRPTASTGNVQPRRKMLATNSTAAASEMSTSRLSAGSCALTSVYSAPSTTPRLHPDPPVEVVGDRRDDEDDQQRREQPVDDERQERQLEDVEADVAPELGVALPEVAAVGEQDPRPPLGGHPRPGDQRQH